MSAIDWFKRVILGTDPAVREMILRQNQLGFDTTFDRFDKQQPQCGFGMAGICCKICNMGPCKITSKSPKGICGADADLIVARNLLRSAAASPEDRSFVGIPTERATCGKES